VSHKLAAGLLPPDKAAVAPQLIFNQQLDAWLTLFFVAVLWVVVVDVVLMSWRYFAGKPVLPSTETPYVATQYVSGKF
jgi:carbon starvation protein